MKVTRDGIDDQQATLSIELAPQDVEPYLARVHRRVAQQVTIPGFRKGKVPRRVLERYVGHDQFMGEVMSDLGPEVTDRALKEQGLEAFSAPDVQVVASDPLTLRATVPLEPTVKTGSYRLIRITPEPTEPAEEQVQEVVEHLWRNSAPWEPVERPARLGDMVTVRTRAKPLRESAQDVVDNLRADRDDERVVLEEGSQQPWPGFSEQVVGLSEGESKEFTLTIADEQSEETREGTEVEFHVSVTGVKEQRLPALDDEFAREVGEAAGTLDELREEIRSSIRQRLADAEEEKLKEKAVEELLNQATVVIPPLLVDREAEADMEGELQLLSRLQSDLDRHLERTGQTREQWREKKREEAEKRLTRVLLLDRVADLEGITVVEEAVEAEIERIESQSRREALELRHMLEQDQDRAGVDRLLRRRRTKERLAEIARGEAQPIVATPPILGTESLEQGRQG